MKNCLLGAAATGAFWLIFLFFFCFLGVHLVRLAKIGWRYQKKHGEKSPHETKRESPARADPPEKETPERKESPAPAAPEPVYYIVERKRRRPKESYSPPKEIKFK